MNKQSILLALFVITVMSTFVEGQRRTPYYDGPYIFNAGDSIRIQWVEKGFGYDTLIARSEAGLFERDSLPVVDLGDLNFKKDFETEYNDVDSIIVISDVHGQYDVMMELLKAQNVVDDDGNWSFGTGHLMVNGDNFDRGDKTLDILWFLFKLEKEAAAVGGKVHVQLGNHEIMVLNGDLRYLNRKYYYTSALYTTPYHQFFGEGSVLGDWIASHKVLTSINNNLFVHAGISPALVRLAYSLDTINQIFRESLVRVDESLIFQDSIHELLYLNEGPLWYRGYYDSLEMALDSGIYVINRTEYDRIIIGHTSFDSITTQFDNRVINTDSNIKLGVTGEVVYIDSSGYYRGKIDGSRQRIPDVPIPQKESLFEHIFAMPGKPVITIQTNVGRMVNKSKREEYQEARFTLADSSGKEIFTLDGRLRARGNVRKMVCRIPPVKFDFSKSDLDSLGFLKLDKLKLLFPCNDRDSDQEKLFQEILIYDLYNFIDTNSIITKLVDFIILEEDGKEKYTFTGALVEDEESYAHRKNAIIVENGKIKDSALDRPSFLKMDFFQYMISNTDWSLANKHNLELVKLPDIARVVALPYDFDYAGFVGQRYAVPHESLPISTIHDRYFFSYYVSESEFYAMVNYFLSIEDDLYRICDEAKYLKEDTIEKAKEYLGTYFKLLRNPEKLKSKILR